LGSSDQTLADDTFDRLMRRYRGLVYRVAYGFTGERESAMDVVQETFLKVHARLGSWRGEGELKSWIARIAANEALNLARSRRRHPTCELDDSIFLLPADERDEDEVAESAIRQEALHRSLALLPPRQRLAVVLRYFEGMSSREISAVLECSEGTARNILFRSLQKLRTLMTRAEESLS
jgi:RNA polymerase sigma-70 factor (ECF subfamily)